jgi:hypothetical protein
VLPVAAAVVAKPGKADKARKSKADKPAPVVPVAPLMAPTSAAAIPAAPSTALDEPYGEALMPRWRRPSLKTARYETPKITAMPSPAMTFARAPSTGLERRIVRYDLVALTDMPDEIQGAQVGQLQANDEVELLERRGAWVQVRTPLGTEGWIHRTTLQSPEDTVAPPTPRQSQAAPPPVAPPIAPVEPAQSDVSASIESDVAMGAFAAATAAAAAAREREAADAAGVAAGPPPVSSPKPAADPKPAERRSRRRSTARSSPNS